MYYVMHLEDTFNSECEDYIHQCIQLHDCCVSECSTHRAFHLLTHSYQVPFLLIPTLRAAVSLGQTHLILPLISAPHCMVTWAQSHFRLLGLHVCDHRGCIMEHSSTVNTTAVAMSNKSRGCQER